MGVRPLADVKGIIISPTEVDPQERARSDLHKAFYRADARRKMKWEHYLSIYDRHLSRFRADTSPVRLLEIGVFKGGSLQMWREYFGPQAVIFGIDVDKRCASLDGADGRVRIGSQDDPAFLQSVIAEMGGIDIVIDDGSHIARHQITSFETLFHLLARDGTYICEDLHTSYWRGVYAGGFRRRSTFLEYAKDIIDDLHADFHRHGQTVRNAHRDIDGIHFYNSMVVIEKGPQVPPRHLHAGAKSSW